MSRIWVGKKEKKNKTRQDIRVRILVFLHMHGQLVLLGSPPSKRVLNSGITFSEGEEGGEEMSPAHEMPRGMARDRCGSDRSNSEYYQLISTDVAFYHSKWPTARVNHVLFFLTIVIIINHIIKKNRMRAGAPSNWSTATSV